MNKMNSAKPLLGKWLTINKPPKFTGECYDIWKIRMQFFYEVQGEEVWDTIKQWSCNSYKNY